MTKATFPELDTDQLAAVCGYIDSLSPKRQRTWKAHLELDWYNARLSGPIHALRNSHGFDWLRSFKLPPPTVH